MPASCSIWTGEGGNETLNKRGTLEGENVMLEVNEQETLANETAWQNAEVILFLQLICCSMRHPGVQSSLTL